MQIYLGRDGKRVGPLSPEEVRSQLASGQVRLTDLAWFEGAPGWVPVSELPGLNPPPLAGASVQGPPPMPMRGPGGVIMKAPGQPQETFAVVSLILGIMGLIMIPIVTSIPGAIFGHLALGRIKRAAGALGGRGLAIAGLITSYLGLLIWMLLVVGMVTFFIWAVPTIQRQEKAFMSEAQGRFAAGMVMASCREYAERHDGNYPPTLEALVPDYLPDDSYLKTTFGGDASPAGFEYFGGKTSDPGEKILFVSRGTDGSGKKMVGRVNGQVAEEAVDVGQELEIPSKER